MPEHRRLTVPEFSPKAWDAICDLVGGEERVTDSSKTWSDSFIVNLGSEENEGKEFKPKELDNWHVDGESGLDYQVWKRTTVDRIQVISSHTFSTRLNRVSSSSHCTLISSPTAVGHGSAVKDLQKLGNGWYAPVVAVLLRIESVLSLKVV